MWGKFAIFSFSFLVKYFSRVCVKCARGRARAHTHTRTKEHPFNHSEVIPQRFKKGGTNQLRCLFKLAFSLLPEVFCFAGWRWGSSFGRKVWRDPPPTTLRTFLQIPLSQLGQSFGLITMARSSSEAQKYHSFQMPKLPKGEGRGRCLVTVRMISPRRRPLPGMRSPALPFVSHSGPMAGAQGCQEADPPSRRSGD